MTAANITRILNNVRVNVPAALDTAINYEFFNALDEFFRRSLCWLETVNFAVNSSTDTYTIAPANGGETTQLMQVINSNKVSVGATMAVPDTIVLVTIPTTTDTFTATIAETVVDPVNGDGTPICPSWILTKYYLGITSGIISRLCMQAAKPYTNPNLAALHTKKFEDVIRQARMEARHENLYGAQRWTYPQNFAPGGQNQAGPWGQPQ